jgi:hypothetical protein
MHETTQENLPASSRHRLRRGAVRFSSVELLISLCLLIFVSPFIQGLPGGRLIEGALITVVFFAAVIAVSKKRRTLILAVVLVTPALVAKWMNHLQPRLFPPAIFLSCAIAFLIFVIVHILRFVLRTPRVTTEVLCASVSAYLLLGVLWAMAYRLAAVITPSAFVFNTAQAANGPMDGFTSFYFSYTTLTTLGYGDITPVSHVARMLSVMESMTGTLYVAVLIARLVGLYSTQDSSTQPDNSDQKTP